MELNNTIKTNIKDLKVLKSTLHFDERGYFLENWRKIDLEKYGVSKTFFANNLQNNVSVSKKGTIRGVHCQGYEKVMTVAYGTFRMCFIDLRLESPTYKEIDTIDVNPGTIIYVPSGVANGAQSLVDNGILNYLVADYYDPNKEYLGIMPLDKDLNLNWDYSVPVIVSEKDNKAKTYQEVINIIENNKTSIAIIGYTGAIGKKIMKYFSSEQYNIDTYNKNNIKDLSKKYYDVVICSAPSSEKFATNINLENKEQNVEDLLDAIKTVKTKHFILISSQSVFQSKSRYSKIQQRVLQTVKDTHFKNTVYLMDTLYSDTLHKGFIYDLINKQWSYITAKDIEEIPMLTEHYKKVNKTTYKRIKDVPLEILNKMPLISNLYSDEAFYQVTKIDDLVKYIKEYLYIPHGDLLQIPETCIYTGKQIKNIYLNPDNSSLGEYFKESKETLENLRQQ